MTKINLSYLLTVFAFCGTLSNAAPNSRLQPRGYQAAIEKAAGTSGGHEFLPEADGFTSIKAVPWRPSTPIAPVNENSALWKQPAKDSVFSPVHLEPSALYVYKTPDERFAHPPQVFSILNPLRRLTAQQDSTSAQTKVAVGSVGNRLSRSAQDQLSAGSTAHLNPDPIGKPLVPEKAFALTLEKAALETVYVGKMPLFSDALEILVYELKTALAHSSVEQTADDLQHALMAQIAASNVHGQAWADLLRRVEPQLSVCLKENSENGVQLAADIALDTKQRIRHFRPALFHHSIPEVVPENNISQMRQYAGLTLATKNHLNRVSDSESSAQAANEPLRTGEASHSQTANDEASPSKTPSKTVPKPSTRQESKQLAISDADRVKTQKTASRVIPPAELVAWLKVVFKDPAAPTENLKGIYENIILSMAKVYQVAPAEGLRTESRRALAYRLLVEAFTYFSVAPAQTKSLIDKLEKIASGLVIPLGADGKQTAEPIETILAEVKHMVIRPPIHEMDDPTETVTHATPEYLAMLDQKLLKPFHEAV